MLTARRYQGAAGAADADGNVTWTLADAPDVAATYTYDFIGRRTAKEVNGRVTRYAYAGLNLAAEFEYNENQPSTAYYYAPGALDHPMAMTRAMTSGDPAAGETFYYHYDERGSVAALTNEAGETVQRYEYDAFGNMTLVEGDVANPFTFTAREWDAETGLYYFRARYYDPETGRFLQTDPIYALGLYAYAENNPVMFTDPLGLSAGTGLFSSDLCNIFDCGTPHFEYSHSEMFGYLVDKIKMECPHDCGYNVHCVEAYYAMIATYSKSDGWDCSHYWSCVKPSDVTCPKTSACAECTKDVPLKPEEQCYGTGCVTPCVGPGPKCKPPCPDSDPDCEIPCPVTDPECRKDPCKSGLLMCDVPPPLTGDPTEDPSLPPSAPPESPKTKCYRDCFNRHSRFYDECIDARHQRCHDNCWWNEKLIGYGPYVECVQGAAASNNWAKLTVGCVAGAVAGQLSADNYLDRCDERCDNSFNPAPSCSETFWPGCIKECSRWH